MFRVGLNVEPHSSSFAQRKIFHCAPLCNSTRPAHLSKSCVMLHAHFALILHYLIARVVVPCFGFLMCIQKQFLSPFISIFFSPFFSSFLPPPHYHRPYQARALPTLCAHFLRCSPCPWRTHSSAYSTTFIFIYVI